MRHTVFAGNSNPLLTIDEMGFSTDPDFTRFGPGKRNTNIIHYVLKGKGYYNGNAVCAGQGFVIYAGQREEYHPDPDDPWEYLWVRSSNKVLRQFFEIYKPSPETMIFNYPSNTAIKKIANELISKTDSIMDSLEMLEMFLHIYNSHSAKISPAKSKTNPEIYLEFVLNYIETNTDKQISIGVLTDLLGISQPYLYKIFYNQFGISPKQYIILHKLEWAKKMLVDSELPVTQIAKSVGYDDVLAFSKIFSAKEKISPKNFRKLNKSKKSPDSQIQK